MEWLLEKNKTYRIPLDRSGKTRLVQIKKLGESLRLLDLESQKELKVSRKAFLKGLDEGCIYVSANMDKNLEDAINTYNDHFNPGKPITVNNLVGPKITENWLNEYSPGDEGSFLKNRYMADLEFGWLATKDYEWVKKDVRKNFEDSERILRILDLWRRDYMDPLIIFDGQLVDGYHRAAMAWHLGIEKYPVEIYEIKR